jgi:hypothetical protein
VNLEIVVAWLVPTIVVVGAVFLIEYDRRKNPTPTVPDLDERARQYDQLRADNPEVPDEEPKAAIMLLEQSKIAYERVAADRSALESRATTLVGLAAAATGASTFLTGGKGLVFTPMIAAAAVLALSSLGCLMFILRMKYNPQPNPASLVLASTVWNQDMEFRICLSLSENYSRGLVVLLADMRKDRILILLATASLVAATALVIANTALSIVKPSNELACSVKYQGSQIVKVECAQ